MISVVQLAVTLGKVPIIYCSLNHLLKNKFNNKLKMNIIPGMGLFVTNRKIR